MGQTPPGDEPELFAPDIVSNGMNNRDVAMMPDGSEMYFSVSFGNYAYSAIVCSKLENGLWTPLEVAPFSTNSKYSYYEPFIAPDGKKMFFVTEEPIDEDTLRTDSNIWVMDRVDNNWSEPYPLPENINTENGEYFPSITRDGVLYYTGVDTEKRVNIILRSKWENGKFADPEILPDHINIGRSRYNATISSDESYLIIPVFGAEDSYGGTDYYISFRDENDNWTDPVNMGPKINTEDNREWSAYVSPDGKYLFFMSARRDMMEDPETITYSYLKEIFAEPQNGNADIYWMSAEIIEELKKEVKQ
ncbi:hypothetical protein ACFLYJ_00835 [Candidatus Cloacimonadota bacterium]